MSITSLAMLSPRSRQPGNSTGFDQKVTSRHLDANTALGPTKAGSTFTADEFKRARKKTLDRCDHLLEATCIVSILRLESSCAFRPLAPNFNLESISTWRSSVKDSSSTAARINAGHRLGMGSLKKWDRVRTICAPYSCNLILFVCAPISERGSLNEGLSVSPSVRQSVNLSVFRRDSLRPSVLPVVCSFFRFGCIELAQTTCFARVSVCILIL